jgi:hypothetical protein
VSVLVLDCVLEACGVLLLEFWSVLADVCAMAIADIIAIAMRSFFIRFSPREVVPTP